MTIDINKQYRTRNNLPVTILKTDLRDAAYPVAAVVHFANHDTVVSYTIEGQYWRDKQSDHDLIEYNPAQDLVLDQPIWVHDSIEDEWVARHFKEYKNGKVYCWPNGYTSHTVGSSNDEACWNFFTTTNPNI